MYVRPPSNIRGEVKIPENYSGNAFSRGSQYSEMPPPIRTQPTRHESLRADIPPDELRELPISEKEEPIFEQKETTEEITQNGAEPTRQVGSSIFSSLLPKTDISSHFPFGHGIGSEELLILAVMLLVFLSGNERGELDSEFLLLLGLLLFAG